MNLSDIITKCYILALFIRDDGERLLLGDGFFEFKESLQHFQPNTFVNDVVELQGTDGQLLAGQVRRTAVQTFEGFIADGTIGREQTETNRRRFLQFFRKKHFYTVVYILPDGSAVQRDRGYIVNAPSAPELYQRFPEYSVGLNFEDPNYYEYDEDSDGDEIPAHSVVLSIANLLEGGLIWDAFGAVSNEKTWLDWENGITVDGLYTFNNGLAGAPLEFTQLDGNATQKTLSGKNLLDITQSSVINQGTYVSGANTDEYQIKATGNDIFVNAVGANGSTWDSTRGNLIPCNTGETIYFSVGNNNFQKNYFTEWDENMVSLGYTLISSSSGSYTPTRQGCKYVNFRFGNGYSVANTTYTLSPIVCKTSDTSYEPYCGGAPSPNPDYPQDVNVVTGRQEVQLRGKNLFDHESVPIYLSYATATPIPTGVRVTLTNANQFRTAGYIIDRASNWLGKKITLTTKWQESSSRVQGHAYVGLCDAAGNNRVAKMQISTSGDSAYFINGAVDETRPYIIIVLYGNYTGASSQIGDYTEYTDVQVEIGDASDFEPYHGQKKAIALDFNIYDKDALTPGYLSSSGEHITGGSASTQWRITDYLPITGGATYKTSGMPNGSGLLPARCYYDASKTFISGVEHRNVNPFTSTAPATARYMRESVQTDTVNDIVIVDTSRTPYELAKIGNYKDAFKVVDGVWYKHAEVGKAVLTGDASESWGVWALSANIVERFYIAFSDHANNDSGIVNRFSYDSGNGDAEHFRFGGSNLQNFVIYINKSRLSSVTVSALRDWLASNPLNVYYQLATPTDTQITEPELLAQLNAIASTFDGVNNITITPSVGAQGELSIHYATGSIDVGAGYEWEEGSDTGTNVIINNGIDSVFPTWIVPGPATNPTLTNITTGQTIVWEGSVASGQTLTVDLNRQTAELGGTNVFAQLSGDWVRLAPGPNKLAYSATGATEGCRLEWNGVVG